MKGVFLFLFTCFAGIANGELTWEKTELLLDASPGAKDVEARFEFMNRGVTPIRILNVESSCSCTIPKVPERAIAPGEKGNLETKFIIGSRRGTQSKRLVVKTDDSKHPLVFLELKINIHEPVSIDPKLVIWRRGENPVTKQVTVQIADSGCKIAQVQTTNDFFRTEVRLLRENTYQIDVTPRQTAELGSSQMALDVEWPDGSVRPYLFHAYIK